MLLKVICINGNFLVYFFRKAAITLKDMFNNIQESSTKPTPRMVIVGQLFDIKRWLDPFINRIAGISKAHHFW